MHPDNSDQIVESDLPFYIFYIFNIEPELQRPEFFLFGDDSYRFRESWEQQS